MRKTRSLLRHAEGLCDLEIGVVLSRGSFRIQLGVIIAEEFAGRVGAPAPAVMEYIDSDSPERVYSAEAWSPYIGRVQSSDEDEGMATVVIE